VEPVACILPLEAMAQTQCLGMRQAQLLQRVVEPGGHLIRQIGRENQVVPVAVELTDPALEDLVIHLQPLPRKVTMAGQAPRGLLQAISHPEAGAARELSAATAPHLQLLLVEMAETERLQPSLDHLSLTPVAAVVPQGLVLWRHPLVGMAGAALEMFVMLVLLQQARLTPVAVAAGMETILFSRAPLAAPAS